MLPNSMPMMGTTEGTLKDGSVGRGRSGRESTAGGKPCSPGEVAVGFRDQTRYFPENAGMFIAQEALPCSRRAPSCFQLGSPPATRTMTAFLWL